MPNLRHEPIATPQGYHGEGLREWLPIAGDDHRQRRWPWILVLVVVVFLFGFFTGTTYAAETEPCIRGFELSPTAMFRLRRYTVEGRVRIERHADHRAYSIAYTSDHGYEGSLTRELNNVEGELSPITQDPHLWKDLPGASYQFVLGVYGPDGALLARRAATIRTPEDDR